MAVKDQFEKDLLGKTPAQKKAYLRENEGRKRWLVTYRDAGGRQGKQRFDREDEANRFDAEQKVTPAQRLAEEAKTLTVEQMMDRWLATKQHGYATKTVEAYRYDAGHVVKAFGDLLARDVEPEDINVWAWRKGYSLAVRERSLKALRRAYEYAIKKGLVAEDPTRDEEIIRWPQADGVEELVEKSKRRSLTFTQLSAVAEAAGPYSAMIWFMGTTGLRIGEVAGLRVGDVNRRTGQVQVDRQRQGSEISLPKNDKTRSAPVTPHVMKMLQTKGRDRDEYLFLSPTGLPVDVHNWRRRVFHRAVDKAGINTKDWKMVPHELRHTAATLAIRSGVDIKQIQQMLGHKKAAMTLDIYGHLWEQNTVAESLEAAIQKYLAEGLDIESEEFDYSAYDDEAEAA